MRPNLIALASAALLVTTAGTAWAGGGDRDDERKDHDDHKRNVERVRLYDADGDRIGTVTLRQKGHIVMVHARLHSLSPGFHGFHVHSVGVCDPDAPDGPFTTAGGHYATGSTTHGSHAGDMPSLLVTDKGRAWLSFATDRFTLADLRDTDGSAVMVHADRDNFANIPTRYTVAGAPGPDATTLATGDAGTRAACGVID